MPTIPAIPPFVIGLIVTLFGLSFAYRCFRACVLGKVNYWSGFQGGGFFEKAIFGPLSFLSMLLIHTPPPPSPQLGKRSTGIDPKTGKRSLERETSGLWVHLIMGPIFLILSVLFLAAGCDFMGLPGTETLNFVMNGGNRLAPTAVAYDKRFTFQFPVIVRALKKFGTNMDKAQIPLPADKRLMDTPESQSNGR